MIELPRLRLRQKGFNLALFGFSINNQQSTIDNQKAIINRQSSIQRGAKMAKAIPVQEREWRAESDAETLIVAAEIEKDSARKKRALAKASKMAQDAEKRAKAARQVASRKNKSNPNPKPKPKNKRKTPKRKKAKK